MKNFVSEIITGIAVLLLLFFVLNPLNIFMPDQLEMLLMVFSIIIFSFFAFFVLRERARDEREALHGMWADRFAYLVGSGFVILAIGYQALSHRIDVWLFIIMTVMILSKLGALIYTRSRL